MIERREYFRMLYSVEANMTLELLIAISQKKTGFPTQNTANKVTYTFVVNHNTDQALM